MIRHRRFPALARLALPVLLAACTTGDETPDDLSGSAPLPPDPAGWRVQLTDQPVDTEALWVALSPIDADTVWLSGTGGGWARTIDGGANWTLGTVAGHEGLQFRDVEAFDASTAVLMSAGTGAESRIFRTEDAGASWVETFAMDHPEGFLDCMAFWSDDRGLVWGDAVDGALYLLATEDGGRSWTRLDPATLPDAQEGEGGFAASGSCVDVRGSGQAWIATAAPEPRVLRTEDGGASWQSTPVPVEAGLTSIGVRPDGRGYAVGGSLDPEAGGVRVLTSVDGGATWSEAGALAMPGAPYGGAWLPDAEVEVLFATGPSGLDWSVDFGASWTNLSPENHWAVGFGTASVGWAVGAGGRITRLDVIRP